MQEDSGETQMCKFNPLTYREVLFMQPQSDRENPDGSQIFTRNLHLNSLDVIRIRTSERH